MKVTFQEFDECFSIDLHAEDLEECALLVRLGLNATKDLRSVTSYAYKDISSAIVIGKRKNHTSMVKP